MSDGSFEQAIGAILQDPQQLQKIFALAQSLGLFAARRARGSPAARAAETGAAAPPAELRRRTTGSSALGELLQQAGKLDRRQENLLNALKPFLKPERREKIDRAMQAARISRLAGAALRGRDQKDP